MTLLEESVTLLEESVTLLGGEYDVTWGRV